MKLGNQYTKQPIAEMQVAEFYELANQLYCDNLAIKRYGEHIELRLEAAQ